MAGRNFGHFYYCNLINSNSFLLSLLTNGFELFSVLLVSLLFKLSYFVVLKPN